MNGAGWLVGIDQQQQLPFGSDSRLFYPKHLVTPMCATILVNNNQRRKRIYFSDFCFFFIFDIKKGGKAKWFMMSAAPPSPPTLVQFGFLTFLDVCC